MKTTRKIEVLPYNDQWEHLFKKEHSKIQTSFLNIGIIKSIHHIGSTAVRHLAAKPIIDMLLEVTSLEKLDQSQHLLEAMGYEAKGAYGIPGRRFFMKGGDQRTHHIHAFIEGDAHVFRHLAFREYLKAHPLIAREYEILKQRVAQSCHHDNDQYCEGKNPFIQAHEAEAVDWYRALLKDA